MLKDFSKKRFKEDTEIEGPNTELASQEPSSFPSSRDMPRLVSLFDEQKQLTLSPNTTDKKQQPDPEWQSFALNTKKKKPLLVPSKSTALLQGFRKPETLIKRSDTLQTSSQKTTPEFLVTSKIPLKTRPIKRVTQKAEASDEFRQIRDVNQIDDRAVRKFKKAIEK